MAPGRFRLLLLAPLLSAPLLGAGAPVVRGAQVAAVPSEIAGAVDAGRADPDLLLEKLVLVFPMKDPEGLDALLRDLRNPASPRFRRWLTPQEFGACFGAPAADLEAVAAWLREEGFAVEGASAGRTAVFFSGRVGDVERAFATELREYARDGARRLANARPLTLPATLGKTGVAGLLPVSGFGRRTPFARPAPPGFIDSFGRLGLAPADFATLYGLDSLYAAARGAGQRIAIVARTNIRMDDTRAFRAFFGLPARDPIVVLNGPDPGLLVNDPALLETNLDIQWAGGMAPDADVVVVVSKSTATTDGIDLSSLYAVDQNVAGVVSVSYGACEQILSPAENTFFANLWAQAAAQGIAVLVSSGDSGAAGCQSSAATKGISAAVNGLGSSPNATSVGGTQFDDGGNPLRYWGTKNDPTTRKSVLMPIPEVSWNESGSVAGGFGLIASGGGASTLYARPSWQSVPGVPAGTQRLIPDVAVSAGSKTPYYLVHLGSLTAVYGTSAGAPAFAGVAGLLGQSARGRLGTLNPMLYELGRRQYAEGTISVFRDITSGSNTVPGVVGFGAGPGYDAVTGLGSPNGAALAAAVAEASSVTPGADFALSVVPAVVALAPGDSLEVRLALVTADGSDPLATLSADLPPEGVSATLSPARTPAAAGIVGLVSTRAPATLRLGASAAAAPRSFILNVAASAAGVTRRVSIVVTVGGAPVPTLGEGVQIPAVVDVPGAGGAHFTSDLVAVNRSAADATLLLRFVPAAGSPGGGGPVVGRSLPAGREFYAPDATAFLAANGYDFSGGSPKGSLFLTFEGVSSPALVFAGSRTSTPVPGGGVDGSFGTFASGIRAGGAATNDVWVYGLREDAAHRSNLALVHAPLVTAPGPITLEVQVFDGATGLSAGAPLWQSLAPGEFAQINRILSKVYGAPVNGYARIRRLSGIDGFIAYGVVNDGGAAGGGTSDGSLIVAGGSGGLVPVIVDIPGTVPYQSELVLANATALPVRATLTFTPAPAWGAGAGGVVPVDLAPGEQRFVPNVIAFLRQAGLPIPGGPQGGTLLVAGAVAQARTFSWNPVAAVGGTFGVSYPALDVASRARSEAFVFGLRQDGRSRSNLAIADARLGGSAVEYVVDIFDMGTGASAPAVSFRRTLRGGEWTQIDAILEKAGISEGYARVRTAAGSSDFVTYGVLNDGAAPGKGTSDGSYLPMVVSN